MTEDGGQLTAYTMMNLQKVGSVRVDRSIARKRLRSQAAGNLCLKVIDFVFPRREIQRMVGKDSLG